MDEVFGRLRSMLAAYESDLTVLHDKVDNYYLNLPSTGKKVEFFGAVQIKKSYVAYHLMPVYYHPELLACISADLKSKMQGKSCFNFKAMDDELFTELSALTKSSFEQYKLLGKVEGLG